MKHKPVNIEAGWLLNIERAWLTHRIPEIQY